MTDFLLQVLRETWSILEDASIFLIFGFALAGVLAVLVPARAMTRLFGTGRVKSVLWASALGAPLPLCSCGVLPTALGLRRQGATDGATVAFLVATPETGLDSVAVSYALTDPLMTIFRPVAGVVTAIAAGLTTNFLGSWVGRGYAAADRPLGEDKTAASENRECHDHDHTHDGAPIHGHMNDVPCGGS